MAVAAVLACAAPLRAHHSISTIDIATPVWLEGVVVEYTVVNPHVMLIVEKSGGERWTVEGPGLGRLARLGLADDFLKLGDEIEVCGFFPKSNAVSSYPPPRFVHGHLLLLARGALQPWGPYGKLDNCVRTSESQRSWVDLLNAQPQVRNQWCNTYTAAVPLSGLAAERRVAAINRLMANPCR